MQHVGDVSKFKTDNTASAPAAASASLLGEEPPDACKALSYGLCYVT